MNKLLLLSFLTLFVCVNFSLNAQVQNDLKCKMTVEEILRDQSFDIDDAIAEDAKYITQDLISELDSIYIVLNTSSEDVIISMEKLEAILVRVKDINLNISMFDSDLEFIEGLK